jgi:hypothetical protein
MATATLQTNSNNDLYLPDGQNLIVITAEDACVQNIQEAVSMRLGEDVFDVLSGVDYLGTIFTPQPSEDDARQSISDAILSCPDVLSIESLTISIALNSFNYVATVNTIYGPLQASNS